MKVPIDAVNPTWSETFDVGLFQWWNLSVQARQEHTRRRSLASALRASRPTEKITSATLRRAEIKRTKALADSLQELREGRITPEQYARDSRRMDEALEELKMQHRTGD